MKNFILLLLVIGAVYSFKPELFSFINNKAAFDEQGNPVTMVFTHNKCGRPCDEAVSLLEKRNVEYSLYLLDDNEANQALWKEYGSVNTFPNIIVGNEKVQGSYKSRIISVLAMNYGDRVLTSTERYYMNNHFYDDGSDKLVMYGASWCGYCKKMRKTLAENNVDYIEIDVEKSSQRKSLTDTLEITGYPLMYYGYNRLEGPNPRDVIALM